MSSGLASSPKTAPQTSPLLTAQSVFKTYRMGYTRLEVLRSCSLQIRPGEFVAIVGKSGCGKSTLLHILGALDTADRGEVRFDNEPLHGGARSLGGRLNAALTFNGLLEFCLHLLAFFAVIVGLGLAGRWLQMSEALRWLQARELLPITPEQVLSWSTALLAAAALMAIVLFRVLLVDRLERRRVLHRQRHFGFVFQFYHLLPELNVLENVLLARMTGCSVWRWPFERRSARRDALEVLTRVGLAERLKHKPSQLSGGERQRVAIARALVHKPRVLLADEPTGNLDAQAGASLMSLLKGLHRDGQTTVLVTHDPGVAQQADRVLVLENGQLRPA